MDVKHDMIHPASVLPPAFTNLRFILVTSLKLVFLGVKDFKSVKCFAGTLSKVISKSGLCATDSFALAGCQYCLPLLAEHVGIVFDCKLKLKNKVFVPPFCYRFPGIFFQYLTNQENKIINGSVGFCSCPFSISQTFSQNRRWHAFIIHFTTQLNCPERSEKPKVLKKLPVDISL